ncbi:tRNA 2-selenouridine synthase [Campylobacter concisus]|uniref:tRNA 2-selenouridine synthase n=1 Tax=Campylobacter concisus TaxID=199 RepID=UPI00122D198A|nr:tRNA 2-selenouridine synthase [Campylobacter concisus]
MKKVKFIVFICLFILLPLAYFNGFIRISDLTSEQESIAKKYGGVYVFDEKLEKEIDKREEERRIMTKGLNGKKIAENRYTVDMTPVNEKLPRVLSNGKKYYVTTRDYGDEFKKKAEVPEIYLNKIIDFIGNDIFYKWQPFISMSYFYLDDNKNIIPIKTGVNYYKGYKIFGLYGDEASGIRLYKETSINISGDNYFYFIDSKFQKISNKDKDK